MLEAFSETTETVQVYTSGVTLAGEGLRKGIRLIKLS